MAEVITLKVVDDQPCPKCGSYWGHPDASLDHPNRPKVEMEGVWWWRCYAPDCPVNYYDPKTGTVIE
jgi:hypothetical protein